MITRHTLLVGLSCLLGTASWGQTVPQIALRLSFNTEANRYEVIAKPTFSARNFTWGPSQVSVVLPAEVVDQTLSIRSLAAGSWSDNSVIYGSVAAPNADFHGLTTQGEKMDLVAGQEYVLFDFGLKGGYVANVRLYDPAKDPNSSKAGMKGGDFRSYMADDHGTDYLKVDSQVAPLQVQAQEAGEVQETSARIVAYPNPSVGGKFRLYMKGFDPKETVTVRLLDNRGVVLRSFAERVETLAGREIDAGQAAGYTVISLERPEKPERLSQKIWIR
ncbi:hypothetical protein [Fibrivirga algicola]|uniref:T9SS type A sorting domain-containing protein n=1 Tax=Fibrivirga algicola TaxID=2950420 RepID=A0ABX0QNZ9_9BACT|nr:hypothetical protein [Fibrivirga algicola]NID12996.1 hypothetical protein [Fibrivirga algicola]